MGTKSTPTAPNPFTPTFGVSPPLLVGRDGDIGPFIEALEEGPGSPYRAMLIEGPRGSGKTVMLNALEDAARERGWVVVSETVRPDVADELAHTTLPHLMSGFAEARETELTGIQGSVAGVGAGITRQRSERYPATPSLRSMVTAVADAAARRGGGLLITLDEVSTDGLADLQVITQVVQHSFREGRQVMFAAAGLSPNVHALLQAPGTTFLRRAERTTLGAVSPADVARAIAEPMMHAGRTIGGSALDCAAAGTFGYPFLVQLVGFHVWRASSDAHEVTLAQAQSAVAAASERVGRLVHEPALAPLSAVDHQFLAAMAADDGPSAMSDVAARMGVDTNYAGQYRLRLINAEIIQAPRRGLVDFALPYLREHVRQRAVPETDDGWTS